MVVSGSGGRALWRVLLYLGGGVLLSLWGRGLRGISYLGGGGDWCCGDFLDTFAVCLCDVSLVDLVAVEVLLLDDLEDFEIFEVLDDLEVFDGTVETMEVWDDLLCSL